MKKSLLACFAVFATAIAASPTTASAQSTSRSLPHVNEPILSSPILSSPLPSNLPTTTATEVYANPATSLQQPLPGEIPRGMFRQPQRVSPAPPLQDPFTVPGSRQRSLPAAEVPSLIAPTIPSLPATTYQLPQTAPRQLPPNMILPSPTDQRPVPGYVSPLPRPERLRCESGVCPLTDRIYQNDIYQRQEYRSGYYRDLDRYSNLRVYYTPRPVYRAYGGSYRDRYDDWDDDYCPYDYE